MDNAHQHPGESRPEQDRPSAVRPCADALVDAEGSLTPDGYVVRCDLPAGLPVTKDELTLLRAFLAGDINAILDGDDQEK